MKRLLVLSFLIAMVFGVTNASVSTGKKDVFGEWKYEAPTAPYGYQKGVLIINEKEGKLAGEVKFEDGYKIELKNVTFDKGVLKCGLYVDYEYISVKVKIEGKKFAGLVSAPDGDMKITAEKKS